MSQSNEDRIRYANNEIIGKGNLSLIDEVFTTGYVVHAGGKEFKGTDSAIPDIRVVDIEFLTQAGDTIAWQRTLSGTHRADMMGIPPSGQMVEWRDMMVSRFDGRKIAEEWAVSELAGQLLLKQPHA